MIFDSTISIGDILSAVVILTAIIALLYQARSVRVSEKQLEMQVEDLKILSAKTKNIAEQIQKEREIRDKLTIEKMEEYAEQMNYTSKVYGESMDYYRANQSQLHEFATMLSIGNLVLLEDIIREKSNKDISGIHQQLEKTLKHAIIFMAISERWSIELKMASSDSEKRRAIINDKNKYDENYSELLSEENGRLKERIAIVNDKFGLRVGPQQYIDMMIKTF